MILVGHSMGGMTVMSLAERHPELFGTKVVGAALIATTAGGLDIGRILFPLLPAGIGPGIVTRVVSTLSRGSRPRRPGAFGSGGTSPGWSSTPTPSASDVPASYVDFIYEMLDKTPFSVVADFFPAFASLDHWTHLEPFERVPTSIICGTGDKITGIGHSRKLHAAINGSDLLECHDAGHMVVLESHAEVNAELDELIARVVGRLADEAEPGGGESPVTVQVRRVGPEAAADVHAVVRAAFGARPALDPPADALGETVESIAAALEAHGGLLAMHDDEPAGALVLDPDGDTLFLRRVGVVPYAQHHGVAADAGRRRAGGGGRLPAGGRAGPGGAAGHGEVLAARGVHRGRRDSRRTSGSSGPPPRPTTSPTPTPCATSGATSRRGSAPATSSSSRVGSEPARPRSPRGWALGSASAAASPRRRS